MFYFTVRLPQRKSARERHDARQVAQLRDRGRLYRPRRGRLEKQPEEGQLRAVLGGRHVVELAVDALEEVCRVLPFGVAVEPNLKGVGFERLRVSPAARRSRRARLEQGSKRRAANAYRCKSRKVSYLLKHAHAHAKANDRAAHFY